MIHLNFQVQQLDGFTPGQRVSGRATEMPIGAVGNPHFSDFMYPMVSPETKTHRELGIVRQIRQSSLVGDFNGKLNSRMNKRFRQTQNAGFSYGEPCFSRHRIGKPKVANAGFPWVITGWFGDKYDLVHFRGSYLEVDLDDMLSANLMIV